MRAETVVPIFRTNDKRQPAVPSLHRIASLLRVVAAPQKDGTLELSQKFWLKP